jgi:alkanesulfonate monooxygenase SsuD/methylene tetrahydromethanopterin reductase-like flavin-dependent oxidoreductase (luciferase family)
MQPMRIGIFLWARNPAPWKLDWYRVYAETLEQAQLAEELGFDSVVTTEHHFAADGYLSAPLALTAAIAARTKRVQVGTWVALLPLYHPLRFAEEAAVVNLISGGRLFLGLGLGYRWEEYEAFGIDRANSGHIVDEALEILVRGLSEDQFNFSGKFFDLRDISITPRPPNRPPIFLGQPTNPRAIQRVARWGLEGFGGAPSQELYDRYLLECARFGTSPIARAQWMLFGHCASDSEVAWQEGHRYGQWAWSQYRDWWWTYGDTRRMAPIRDDPMWVFGDGQMWLDRINSRKTVVPTSDVFICLQLPGMPHNKVMRSMELFASKVLPALRAGES